MNETLLHNKEVLLVQKAQFVQLLEKAYLSEEARNADNRYRKSRADGFGKLFESSSSA
jgi:hypothetical protein